MSGISIIGSVIGGLTTGIALQKHGIDHEIYEAFSEFKDLEAGIMLANNAIQVYQRLNLYSEIIDKGHIFKSVNVRKENLDKLSTVRTNEFSENKIESVAIHRNALQRVLLEQIPTAKNCFGQSSGRGGIL